MKEVILGRAEKQAWACCHWEIERWGLNDGDYFRRQPVITTTEIIPLDCRNRPAERGRSFISIYCILHDAYHKSRAKNP